MTITSYAKDALERAGKTAGQVFVVSLGGSLTSDEFANAVDVEYRLLVVPIVGALVSFATSWVSKRIGNPETPSLVQ